MANENTKVTKLRWNSFTAGFRGRWLRILTQNSGIQNRGSNLVDRNAKIYFFRFKLFTGERGLADDKCGHKITKFKIATQYGGPGHKVTWFR